MNPFRLFIGIAIGVAMNDVAWGIVLGVCLSLLLDQTEQSTMP